MGTRGALGMILHAEYAIRLTADALYGAVEQVDMRCFESGPRKAFFVYRIGMVLRGNLNLPGFQIPDWVVSASMTEFQFIGCCAVCQRNQLMPEADPKERIVPDQTFQRLNDAWYVRRIAGAV